MSDPTQGAPPPPPRVGIVVLNWNNYPVTERCLRSILGLTYPAVTVYLADNGSTDGSMDRLERELAGTGVVFLRNRENVGFAAGNNPAIARALDEGCAYVLLLNNDCIAAGPSLLEEAVRLSESDPRCGVVGGKLLYWPDTDRIWSVGGETGWRSETFIGLDETDRGQYAEVADRGFISGALMLIKREVFDRIGLLPDAYFFGYEDREFSVLARRAGYRMLYCPGMVVFHETGGSHATSDPMYVYNDALSRVLFKRRTLSPFAFRMWLAFYRLYLELLHPAREVLQRSAFPLKLRGEQVRATLREALADAPKVERITADTLAAFRARHAGGR